MSGGRKPLEPGTYGQGTPKKNLKTGKFVIRVIAVHPTGVRRRISGSGRNATIAQQDLRDNVAKYFDETLEPADTQAVPTLSAAIKSLIDEGLAVGRWRGSSVRNYRRALQWLERHEHGYGSTLLSEVDEARLRRAVWVDAHEHRQRARQVRTVLRQTFSWAVSQGHVERNPFVSDPIEFPKQRSLPRPRALSTKDRELLDELLDRYEQRDRPGPKPTADARDLIEVLLATGYRIREALGILAEDITVNSDDSVTLALTGSVVERDDLGRSIKPTRVGTTKTTDESEEPVRLLRLDGKAAEVLRRRARSEQTGLIFHTRTGTPYQKSNWRRTLNAVLDGELPWLTNHSFRRTAATELAARRGSGAAADLLGHRSPGLTESVYIAPATIVDLRS